jgi:phosphatidylinositol alpha 1,6-mannosyltransferase
MNRVPRVAFFTDCFHEINGVALTSRHLHEFARQRGYPFLSVHAGPRTEVFQDGSVTVWEFDRGPWSIALEADMSFDPVFLRHRFRARDLVAHFQPDLIHITGPGDCGLLGAWLAWRMRIPLVASWHTNVHEYGAHRLQQTLSFLPERWAARAGEIFEQYALAATTWYYRHARVILAPNPALIAMLRARTGKPVFLMQRGIDTVRFDPAKRNRTDDAVVLGFVGRLSTEKNVRFLVKLERALLAAGVRNFRFLVVGQGRDLPYLKENLQHAVLTGALRGEALAQAYANMDVFVFPSETDTFGNVIQEALASGVPAVVTSRGGPQYLIQHGITGLVAKDSEQFIQHVRSLVLDHGARLRMGEAARRHALTITWEKVLERVYSAYESCGEMHPERAPKLALAGQPQRS